MDVTEYFIYITSCYIYSSLLIILFQNWWCSLKVIFFWKIMIILCKYITSQFHFHSSETLSQFFHLSWVNENLEVWMPLWHEQWAFFSIVTHFIIAYHISLVKVQTNYCNNNLLILDVKQLTKIKKLHYFHTLKALWGGQGKIKCIIECPGLKSSYWEKGLLNKPKEFWVIFMKQYFYK